MNKTYFTHENLAERKQIYFKGFPFKDNFYQNTHHYVLQELLRVSDAAQFNLIVFMKAGKFWYFTMNKMWFLQEQNDAIQSLHSYSLWLKAPQKC